MHIDKQHTCRCKLYWTRCKEEFEKEEKTENWKAVEDRKCIARNASTKFQMAPKANSNNIIWLSLSRSSTRSHSRYKAKMKRTTDIERAFTIHLHVFVYRAECINTKSSWEWFWQSQPGPNWHHHAMRLFNLYPCWAQSLYRLLSLSPLYFVKLQQTMHIFGWLEYEMRPFSSWFSCRQVSSLYTFLHTH